jgi:hypothetical protein
MREENIASASAAIDQRQGTDVVKDADTKEDAVAQAELSIISGTRHHNSDAIVKAPIASLLVALVASAPAAGLELPDARVTPGAIGSSDPAIVCVRGYSRTVRPPYDHAWRRFSGQRLPLVRHPARAVARLHD